jgi:hypothetical protein
VVLHTNPVATRQASGVDAERLEASLKVEPPPLGIMVIGRRLFRKFEGSDFKEKEKAERAHAGEVEDDDMDTTDDE